MNISPKQYASVLFTMLEKGTRAKETCKEFTDLLIERGETGKLHDIKRAFDLLVAKKEGTIFSDVISARDDHAHVAPKTFEGKKVEERIFIDGARIAGVRVRIGDSLIDNTMRRRLNNLKTALT